MYDEKYIYKKWTEKDGRSLWAQNFSVCVAVVKCFGLVRFASILRLRLAPVIGRIAWLDWMRLSLLAIIDAACLLLDYYLGKKYRLHALPIHADKRLTTIGQKKARKSTTLKEPPKWADIANRLITCWERETLCSSSSSKKEQVNTSGKFAVASRFIAFAYLLALGDRMSIMKGWPKKLGIT